MKVVIKRGGIRSFGLWYSPKDSFVINIAQGDDMIEVFRCVNETLKTLKTIKGYKIDDRKLSFSFRHLGVFFQFKVKV